VRGRVSCVVGRTSSARVRDGDVGYPRAMALNPSEYGGSDTDDTNGIQPAPHEPNASERLRLLYASGDPADPLSGTAVVGMIGKA